MPRFIYRYVSEESHARAFLSGRVWLSTFSEIRRADTARGDPDDGTHSIYVERLDDSTPEAEAMEIRRRLMPALAMEPGSGLSGITLVHQWPDAFVLCASLSRDSAMRQRFGEFCVRIADPEAFGRLTAMAIVASGVPLDTAMGAPVQYQGRLVEGAKGEMGHPAFANVTGNQDEREYRTVWTPKDGTVISPREIFVPGVEALCSLV